MTSQEIIALASLIVAIVIVLGLFLHSLTWEKK